MTARVEPAKVAGPTGFLQYGNHMFVVDYGKIMREDGTQIGMLWEDGLIQGTADPFGPWSDFKAIEELNGAMFQGIDTRNIHVVLPGPERGPVGGLKYNNQDFIVLFGRIATQDHKLVGRMTDDGTLFFRDPRFPDTMRQMDEFSQLSTYFQGTKSDGQAWKYEFQKPLHKPDKTYWENEIMRYFVDIDRINGPQKKYVFDTMKLFAMCGLLQVVRKSEGTAGLGNVKHGASGVTGIRTGNVTLDREEFEREVNFFKKFGSLMAVPSRPKPYIEVRLNMVVPHEYGHQLEFCLSAAAQKHVEEIYDRRLSDCNRLHPLPEEAETYSELIQPQQLEDRIFVSGYARVSWHEYFAECVAAFANKESRETLKQYDPVLHQLLMDVVMFPEKVMSTMLQKDILNLQASLRVGGEFKDDLLNQ